MSDTLRSPPVADAPKVVITPKIDDFAIRTMRTTRFVGRFFTDVFKPPFHLKELINQCYAIGVMSLPLVTLTGFITGLVFTKQSRPSLAAFGATSWLPSLITIALVRSLAPLITALICAGKVGSSIGAEVGSMKVTEQIDAMEVSGINPFKFLAVNRTLATTMMLPALALYCAGIALLGAFLNVHGNEGTSFQAFLNSGFSTISFLDIWTSVAKTFLFGFTIGIISTYKGFHASSGTRGVGQAANASVVMSMFVIFVEEVLVVQIITWLRGG